jgi:hypothetical protein
MRIALEESGEHVVVVGDRSVPLRALESSSLQSCMTSLLAAAVAFGAVLDQWEKKQEQREGEA